MTSSSRMMFGASSWTTTTFSGSWWRARVSRPIRDLVDLAPGRVAERASDLARLHRPLRVEGQAHVRLLQPLLVRLDLVEERGPAGLDAEQEDRPVSTRGVQVFPNHLVGQAAAPLPSRPAGPWTMVVSSSSTGWVAAEANAPARFSSSDAVVEVTDAEAPEAGIPGRPRSRRAGSGGKRVRPPGAALRVVLGSCSGSRPRGGGRRRVSLGRGRHRGRVQSPSCPVAPGRAPDRLPIRSRHPRPAAAP